MCVNIYIYISLTILCELGGTHQSSNLEGVLADGTVAQVLRALARGEVAFLLQLELGGWEAQIKRRVLQLLHLSLKKAQQTNEHTHSYSIYADQP